MNNLMGIQDIFTDKLSINNHPLIMKDISRRKEGNQLSFVDKLKFKKKERELNAQLGASQEEEKTGSEPQQESYDDPGAAVNFYGAQDPESSIIQKCSSGEDDLVEVIGATKKTDSRDPELPKKSKVGVNNFMTTQETPVVPPEESEQIRPEIKGTFKMWHEAEQEIISQEHLDKVSEQLKTQRKINRDRVQHYNRLENEIKQMEAKYSLAFKELVEIKGIKQYMSTDTGLDSKIQELQDILNDL